jgi:hypothetical protein
MSLCTRIQCGMLVVAQGTDRRYQNVYDLRTLGGAGAFHPGATH